MENVPFLNLEYFFYLIYYAFTNFDLTGVWEAIKAIMPIIQVFSFIISGFFIVVIIYAIEKTKAIRTAEAEQYEAKVVPAYDEKTKGDPKLAERWRKILELTDSQNQNDWMLAIIEADIILGDMLETMGYQGDSIGEKLKRIEPS